MKLFKALMVFARAIQKGNRAASWWCWKLTRLQTLGQKYLIAHIETAGPIPFLKLAAWMEEQGIHPKTLVALYSMGFVFADRDAVFSVNQKLIQAMDGVPLQGILLKY